MPAILTTIHPGARYASCQFLGSSSFESGDTASPLGCACFFLREEDAAGGQGAEAEAGNRGVCDKCPDHDGLCGWSDFGTDKLFRADEVVQTAYRACCV
ncbi:hypothetical protein ACJZ2D_005415 [Fusarium nematophilum]